MTATSSADRSFLHAVFDLEALNATMSERELIERGIEIAQARTASAIGYVHYVNEDQITIELGAWSRATRGYCSAVYDRHYPLTAAGIWADSARTRVPCIHNDYATAPHKRGMPEGHSPLRRHLGVPVVDDGKVRLLIGVGNKAADYDAGDVEVVQFVGRRTWALIRQRRTHERAVDLERRLWRVQEIAAVCGWEYDVEDDVLHVDTMFRSLFRLDDGEALPASLRDLLAFVAPADQERLRDLLADSPAGTRRMLQVACRRADGARFPVEFKAEFRPRDPGRGVIATGILQDVSEQLEIENLRRRADMDALTGLPNRNRLRALFEQGQIERRGPHEHFAFFYIDLDDFKPVNDTHGHALGDEVLRIVASRLQHAVRKDDLVVRLGGDEFAVVQAGVSSVAAAETMAEKIIAGISEPMALDDRLVRVGASVGIAVRADLERGLDEVSTAADRALYRAKAAGGGCWIVDASIDPGTPGAPAYRHVAVKQGERP